MRIRQVVLVNDYNSMASKSTTPPESHGAQSFSSGRVQVLAYNRSAYQVASPFRISCRLDDRPTSGTHLMPGNRMGYET